MRRRDFIAAIGGAAALPIAALAQKVETMRRIGVQFGIPENDPVATDVRAALESELQRLGWTVGRNVRIDYRSSSADGSRSAAIADELVNLRPDLIFAYTGAPARAAQLRTQTIPIVFVGGGDAAATNTVNGIARPAGNATGFASSFSSLGGKWLDLLKKAEPRLTRVGHLVDPQRSTQASDGAATAAATQLGIAIVTMPVSNPDEVARAINAFATEPDGGLLITGPHSEENANAIWMLALKHRLPTMFGAIKLARDGLLMSNGPDVVQMTRGAAGYVDRILRGAKSSDLPVQYPTRFPLVLNLKTAKAIGLELPPTFLALADEVIK